MGNKNRPARRRVDLPREGGGAGWHRSGAPPWSPQRRDLLEMLACSGLGAWRVDLLTQTVAWCPRTRAIHEVDEAFTPTLETAIAFYAEEARPILRQAIETAMADGTPWDVRLPFTTARGRCLIVRARGMAVRQRGRVVRLVGTFEDVTQAESAAVEHARLAHVVRQMNNAAIITDAAGLTVWVNPAFERLTGYGLADLVGRTPGSVLQGPGTDPATVAEMRAAIRAGRGFTVEVVNHTRRGDPYWISIETTPLTDPAGRLTGFVAIETDITERRRAAEAMQAEIARREAAEGAIGEVLDALPSGVIVYGADERLRFVNRAYRDIFPRLAPLLREGDTIEEVLRKGVAAGQYAAEIRPDAPEEDVARWTADLAARLRATGGRREIALPDGRWLQARERRSPSGMLVCLRTDITRIKNAETEAQRLAETDPLTNLPNRRALLARLERATAAAEGRAVALLLIDLCELKAINDTHGHLVGDALLCHIAARLESCVGPHGLAARLDGTGFALLCGQVNGRRDLLRAINRVRSALAANVDLPGLGLRPSLCIGAALWPEDATDGAALLRAADLALGEAKRGGPDRAVLFEPGLVAGVERRAELGQRLGRALAEERITVHLQPQVAVADGRHLGFEALARWSDRGTPIPPAEFVPVAEETGLSMALGRAVMAAAFAAQRRMHNAGLAPGVLAINVSTAQLLAGAFLEETFGLLVAHDLDPNEIEFEVTETVLLDGGGVRVEATLKRLRAAGFRLALDDFGTGYASLAHLPRFPVQRVKIDRSFVSGTPGGGVGPIARAVIRLGRDLGLETLAEGVETEAQAQALRAAGCDAIQGYLVAPPLPVDEAIAFLRRGARPPISALRREKRLRPVAPEPARVPQPDAAERARSTTMG